MANNYIYRDDAVSRMSELLVSELHMTRCPTWNEVYNAIGELPSADVVQVVHGRWIKYTGMGKVQWMCSECSAEEKNPKVANYCYHCGAKMDGGDEHG